MEGLKPGRIVYFVVDEDFVGQVNPNGNVPNVSDVLPAMVTRVWTDDGCVNLKVITDGPHDVWVTSVSFNGTTPCTWKWMYEGQATRGEAK